ncbi:tetratricopeptide repeat protein [Roseovarius sp.]|uniref:tetratricopeptide repeat protein n=1 Tax=Roseovarius sp. TaxID=1486281 RepID=UPI00257D428F|nr:tetratricopeptide repeat protein [Roseovarius sp.]
MRVASLATTFLLGLASGTDAAPLDEGRAAFEAGRYEAAMQAFSDGFRQGDAASGYYLARMLELGLGIDPDPAAALRLYRLAAEAGHVEALNRVALMHYRGEAGVAQDYTEAARLFGRAAEQGDRNALFNLGKLHFEGKGVPKDVPKALANYRQAAELDHILALNTLGALYRGGGKNAEDRGQAKAYFERSAALGNAVGLFEMARITLEEGTDPAHQIDAHMYLNLASARAHPNAARALQDLTAAMARSDVELAQGKARAFVAVPDAGAR